LVNVTSSIDIFSAVVVNDNYVVNAVYAVNDDVVDAVYAVNYDVVVNGDAVVYDDDVDVGGGGAVVLVKVAGFR
jgi:hypothetical protein